MYVYGYGVYIYILLQHLPKEFVQLRHRLECLLCERVGQQHRGEKILADVPGSECGTGPAVTRPLCSADGVTALLAQQCGRCRPTAAMRCYRRSDEAHWRTALADA